MAELTVRLGSAERVRARAPVDLGAVERNCATLKRHLGRAQLCAVVKADGYGHGAVACARAALAGGATWLAVAAAAEAAELRADGIAAPLLVMGALTGAELEVALDASADVVAWTEEFLRAVEATDRPARVHVKLDTGMHRLGTPDPDVARRLVDRVAREGRPRPGRRDDPLRDRGRAGLGLLRHAARALSPVRGGGQAHPSRLHRARRQQRSRAAQRGRPFRHGALRHRGLRHGSVRREPVAARPRAGAVAPLLCGGRQGACRRRVGGLRPQLVGARPDACRGAADRLRRRLPARAVERGRRA